MRKESTTSIMRRGFISTLAMCAAMFMSCSSENDIINNNGVGENGEPEFEGKGIICTVEQQELVNFDDEARSTLSFGTAGMDFAWQDNDKLTIFPTVNDAIAATYTLSDKRGSSLNAFFTADGFQLNNNEVYYAISKKQGDALSAPGCDFSSKRNLKFNYDGQRQTGNNTTTHLGNYDYMAASGLSTENNMVSLRFKHLGPTLRIIIQAPQILDGSGNIMSSETTAAQTEFKGKSFTELTVYSSDNTFRQPVRYLDLTQGLQLDNTYSPKWKDIDRTTDDYINAKPFTLKLGPAPVAPSTDETGFQPNDKGNIIAYMIIPPENFTGKNIVFNLKAKDGTEYYSTYTDTDLNLDPANAYQMVTRAKKATQFEVTLKINHLYQHGDEETSRATGDPGYDKDLTLPTHIYYIFCVDGKVKKVKVNGDENAVNKITGIPSDHWSTESQLINDGKSKEVISTYTGGTNPGKTFTFNITEGETSVTKNVYFVASKGALPDAIFSGIAEGVAESKVQALLYDIQGDNQTESQTFLSGLYSTPFVSNETFVGRLTGSFHDIFLYHTAAKVDLKWNCATAATSVSVSGVQEEDLSLFKPTTNSGSGDYSVSTTNSIGTQWNGRQVYYLPQFANNQYNVRIGTHNYNSYEFTDVSTEGGYTSWYRALIKQ